MIIHGNKRGGARDLALHLLKEENDHVEVHELRGFISDDLTSALNEAYVISKGTHAKKFLFSVSLNPPKGENVSTEAFKHAATQLEQEFGLEQQPRGLVFHDKKGRRHAHCVWSLIDTQEMKAIKLDYSKRRMQDISRSLYLEHGWEMPPGMLDRQNRDPNNFTMAQWQQARRIGKDPRSIKQALQSAWALSDDKASFEAALKEKGYHLARGDRRGFVALDHKCEIFSLGKKWIGVPVKDIRAKLGDENKLSSVQETRTRIAKDMQTRLQDLQDKQADAFSARQQFIQDQLNKLRDQQRQERKNQKKSHEQRQQEETQARQTRFNKGIKGLIDRVTGKRRRIMRQNEQETNVAAQRDQKEKDALVFKQADQRQSLQQRSERLETFKQHRAPKLKNDIQQYRDIMQQKREVFDRMQGQRRESGERKSTQTRGPSLER